MAGLTDETQIPHLGDDSCVLWRGSVYRLAHFCAIKRWLPIFGPGYSASPSGAGEVRGSRGGAVKLLRQIQAESRRRRQVDYIDAERHRSQGFGDNPGLSEKTQRQLVDH